MVSIPLIHAICRRLPKERDPEKFKDLVGAIRLIFDEAVEARLVEHILQHQLNLLADVPDGTARQSWRKAA